MAILAGVRKHNDKKDTMTKIISKNKSVEILDYFLNFPFAKVLSNETKKTLVVHAGILPTWSIEDVKAANEELTSSLKSNPEKFLDQMYGDRRKAISKSTNKKNRRRYLLMFYQNETHN